MVLLNFEEAVARYGPIVNGVWANEGKWCSVLQVPDEIAPTLINSATGLPTHHIYCNTDMQGPLSRAFQKIIMRGLVGELETFDGCFMIRDIRGVPGKLSVHAYALALDLNSGTNPLGGPSTMSPKVVACFEEEGFRWGGDFHRCDPMHLQLADW